MNRLCLLGLIVLASCQGVNLDPSKITFPTLPAIDIKLPKSADGKYLLLELSSAQLELDPTIRDPLTALGECSDQVTYCFAPSVRSLDDCMHSVRTCNSDKPWLEPTPCCAKKCQDDYATARDAGLDPTTALDQVLYGGTSCSPGVAGALAGN